MSLQARTAARVLLVDAEDRLLLMHERRDLTSSDNHWITPGGGVEAGESLVQAAVRELYEETGISLDLPAETPVVHTDEVAFCFAGAEYLQRNHYLFARCEAGLAVAPAGHTDFEKLVVLGWRWWTLIDLERAPDVREPVEVVDIVRSLLAQEVRR